MDINLLRAIFTVIMFVLFIGIFLWAWSNRQAKRFHTAANLPFNEPEQPESTNPKENIHE